MDTEQRLRAAATGVPLQGMRKVIAKKLTLSWQTIPHVHLTMEVDMSEAMRLKEKVSGTLKVSYTDIIVKHLAQTLIEFRVLNNSFVDDKVMENEAINIGIAVALDDGLIVPVIRNADRKTVQEVSEEASLLAVKARNRKLVPDDCAAGTFTVTNLGMYGVDHFTPIINPPQSAILGVCRLEQKPVVIDGAVSIRPMMKLCLGFDHRLIDGAVAARFMARLCQYLTSPCG